MRNKMDLHIHTIYSDGDKTPKQIIEMAKESGLTTISITDHNMITGLKTLTEEDLEGIEFIPGVELSAKVDKARMHILGYGIDVNNKYINDKLNDRVDVKNIYDTFSENGVVVMDPTKYSTKNREKFIQKWISCKMNGNTWKRAYTNCTNGIKKTVKNAKNGKGKMERSTKKVQ